MDLNSKGPIPIKRFANDKVWPLLTVRNVCVVGGSIVLARCKLVFTQEHHQQRLASINKIRFAKQYVTREHQFEVLPSAEKNSWPAISMFMVRV